MKVKRLQLPAALVERIEDGEILWIAKDVFDAYGDLFSSSELELYPTFEFLNQKTAELPEMFPRDTKRRPMVTPAASASSLTSSTSRRSWRLAASGLARATVWTTATISRSRR
jgi:hypothetical protein